MGREAKLPQRSRAGEGESVSKEERSGRREWSSRPKRVTEQLLGRLLQPTSRRVAFLTEQGGLTAGHGRPDRLGEMAGRSRTRWRAGSGRERDGSRLRAWDNTRSSSARKQYMSCVHYAGEAKEQAGLHRRGPPRTSPSNMLSNIVWLVLHSGRSRFAHTLLQSTLLVHQLPAAARTTSQTRDRDEFSSSPAS